MFLIYRGAFENCVNLISIDIPNSVEDIQFDAFKNCTNLNLVTIGKNVAEIGSDAFGNCMNLKLINCVAMAPPKLEDSSFEPEVMKTVELLVSSKALEAYKKHPIWGKFKNLLGDR